jgi:hypothetical protein
MSTFIATTISMKNGKITVKGGDSNVVPRPNNWFVYEKKEHLFENLISGTIDITRCKTLFAAKVRKAYREVEQKHAEEFGTGHPFGHPFTLYKMQYLKEQTKDGYVKRGKEILEGCNYIHYAQSYKNDLIENMLITEANWDRLVSFYINIEDKFIREISL